MSTQQPPPPEPPPAAKRRDLLTWLLGSWAAGVLGAVVYPMARFLVPPPVPESTTVSASGGSASGLQPNTGRVVPFGSEAVIVIRTGTGDLRAFAATCTHLTCTVQYRADLQHVWCACHNGHYDLTGRNISGPPPRPLEVYDVAVQGDELIISRHS